MSTDDEKQERREECRREVLRYLADRSVLAFRAETIRNSLHREHKFSIEEIISALEFERGAGRVSIEPHRQGATNFYRITSEGTLFHERNP